jgi:hypothetical protein
MLEHELEMFASAAHLMDPLANAEREMPPRRQTIARSASSSVLRAGALELDVATLAVATGKR